MTSLRPAFETILTHGSNAVVLRASLRAASNIEALPGGLADTLDQIAGQNYSTTKAVIRATATDAIAAERLLASLEGQPLQHFTERAQAAILAVVQNILPASKEAASESPSASATPWHEHFANLFGFGTGWLGWAPETVWNASIAEIEHALDAHVKKLVAMNGGSEGDDTTGKATGTASNIYTAQQLQQVEELGHDPAFDRAGLRALQARQ